MVDPDGGLWRARAAPQQSPNASTADTAGSKSNAPLQDRASLPLDAIRRPRNTPIWKLEAALKCRSCKKGRYAPPVHMIKLTQEREITPYVWVHLDEER
jgi:hypothetical protein